MAQATLSSVHRGDGIQHRPAAATGERAVVEDRRDRPALPLAIAPLDGKRTGLIDHRVVGRWHEEGRVGWCATQVLDAERALAVTWVVGFGQDLDFQVRGHPALRHRRELAVIAHHADGVGDGVASAFRDHSVDALGAQRFIRESRAHLCIDLRGDRSGDRRAHGTRAAAASASASNDCGLGRRAIVDPASERGTAADCPAEDAAGGHCLAMRDLVLRVKCVLEAGDRVRYLDDQRH